MLAFHKERQCRDAQQEQSQLCHGVDKLLLGRELGSVHTRHQSYITGKYFDRQIECLRPEVFNRAQWLVDKAFCSAWLDDAHVLLGTKCNTLLCLHAPSRTHTVISYPEQPVHRQGPDLFTGPRFVAGQHAIAVSPDGRFVATGGEHTQDIVLWQVVQSSGVSARQPSTSLRPLQTLMGHVDWVFGLAWVNNHQFVSAGRDETIKLWQVPHAAAAAAAGSAQYSYQRDDPGAAVMSVKFHKDKVRDIRFDQQQQQVAAVCVDRSISWWTPDLLLQGSYQLPEQYDDPVVVQPCGSLLVVGCKEDAVLIDTRVGQRVAAAVAASTGNSSKRRRISSRRAAAGNLHETAAAASNCDSTRRIRQEGLQAMLHDVYTAAAAAAAHGSNACNKQAVGQDSPPSPSTDVHRWRLQQHADGFGCGYESRSEEDLADDAGEGVSGSDIDSDGGDEDEDNNSMRHFMRLMMMQPHHSQVVHDAYEQIWGSTPEHDRLVYDRWRGGQHQPGLKRLLEGAAVPDSINMNNAALSAEFTGAISVDGWGVRSLSLQHHLLGVGTGDGDLSFHDLRRMSNPQQLLEREFTRSAGSPSALASAATESPCRGFATFDGDEVFADPAPEWIKYSCGRLPARVHRLTMPDAPAMDLFEQEEEDDDVVPSAVYTHCWDPTATKLFVGGGPLHAGYAGCSLSLYSA